MHLYKYLRCSRRLGKDSGATRLRRRIEQVMREKICLSSIGFVLNERKLRKEPFYCYFLTLYFYFNIFFRFYFQKSTIYIGLVNSIRYLYNAEKNKARSKQKKKGQCLLLSNRHYILK